MSESSEKIESRQTVPIELDLLAAAKKRWRRLGFRSFGAYCKFLIQRDLMSQGTQQPGLGMDLTAEEASYLDALLRLMRSKSEHEKWKTMIIRFVLEYEADQARRRRQASSRFEAG